MEDYPRILIIGASGFLGSKLFEELAKALPVAGTCCSRPLADLIRLDTVDKKQVKALLNKIRPDVLIDCAGMTRPDACELDQQRAYQVNVEGIANLTEASTCKIIYFSTDYVFDGEMGQYTEYDSPHPINYYGWTKLEAENIVLTARSDNVVLRVSGLYGKSGRNNEFLSSLTEPIVYRAVDCFASNLLLDDVVRHISFFWSASGLYHLTDGRHLSRFEFASKAIRILDLPAQVIGKPARDVYRIAQRPRDSSLISKRHSLPIRNEEIGLSYLKHHLGSNCS